MGCRASKLCLSPGARKKRRHKAKNEQELNDVNDNGTQKIKDNEQEIQNLLQRFQEEKVALEKANSLKLEELECEVKEQAKRDAEAETERRLSEKATEMKAEMDVKIAELQKSFEKEKASLTETITDLKSQLESFLQKIQQSEESALKQNYERHIKVQKPNHSTIGTSAVASAVPSPVYSYAVSSVGTHPIDKGKDNSHFISFHQE